QQVGDLRRNAATDIHAAAGSEGQGNVAGEASEPSRKQAKRIFRKLVLAAKRSSYHVDLVRSPNLGIAGRSQQTIEVAKSAARDQVFRRYVPPALTQLRRHRKLGLVKSAERHMPAFARDGNP